LTAAAAEATAGLRNSVGVKYSRLYFGNGELVGLNVVEHASSRYEQETPAPDALVKTFERDDALWFDNAYSDVVP
jgi:hypothetical protein